MILLNSSTSVIREVGVCCFSQDEQSNPSRELQVMGHFLNANVDQIKLVVLVTFVLLVNGGIVPPAMWWPVMCSWESPEVRGSHMPSQIRGSLSFPTVFLLWCPPSRVVLGPPASLYTSRFCGFLWLQPRAPPLMKGRQWDATASYDLWHMGGDTLLCVLSAGVAPKPLVPNAPQRFWWSHVY